MPDDPREREVWVGRIREAFEAHDCEQFAAAHWQKTAGNS
jgi:hypothetical protein